jgi:hypothetical protein
MDELRMSCMSTLGTRAQRVECGTQNDCTGSRATEIKTQAGGRQGGRGSTFSSDCGSGLPSAVLSSLETYRTDPPCCSLSASPYGVYQRAVAVRSTGEAPAHRLSSPPCCASTA